MKEEGMQILKMLQIVGDPMDGPFSIDINLNGNNYLILFENNVMC